MSKVRMIVSVKTKKGVVHELNKTLNGYVIKDISFRRDGLVSINHGNSAGGAHYLIVLEDPMNDKDVVNKVIPYDNVEEILFIHAEKQDGDPSETAPELKRA
jgi:hypothetical protein